jgi:hypothetical protein
VTTAKITDLAVNTLKIANQAVTIPTGAYTSSDFYSNSIYNSTSLSSYSTVQSVTYTSSGAPVVIIFSFAAEVAAKPDRPYSPEYGYVYGQLYRGSTFLTDIGPVKAVRGAGIGSTFHQVGGTFIDSATGTGSRTYFLKVARKGYIGQVNKRSLVALEVKK